MMVDEREYLTVKEFIKVVDRTEQSIYKRLKNSDDELNNFSKKFSHGIKLHINAIREVYARDLTNEQIFGLINRVEEVEPKVDEVKQHDTTQDKQEEETNNNNKMIEILEREIEKKDKIIDDLTQSLQNQQQLSLADKQTILKLQDDNKKLLLLSNDKIEVFDDEIIQVKDETPSTLEQKPKKKGILDFLFKRGVK